MKKIILIIGFLVVAGVSFAGEIRTFQQPVPVVYEYSQEFQKATSDVGVIITKDSYGNIVKAVAITRKTLEAQALLNNQTGRIAQERLTILNAE